MQRRRQPKAKRQWFLYAVFERSVIKYLWVPRCKRGRHNKPNFENYVHTHKYSCAAIVVVTMVVYIRSFIVVDAKMHFSFLVHSMFGFGVCGEFGGHRKFIFLLENGIAIDECAAASKRWATHARYMPGNIGEAVGFCLTDALIEHIAHSQTKELLASCMQPQARATGNNPMKRTKVANVLENLVTIFCIFFPESIRIN